MCRGDEIITVAAGFPTTVTPAIQYGAVPVFVDVTIPQYNIDADKLEAALSEKTKAVMIAHTLGNPFDRRQLCQKSDRLQRGDEKRDRRSNGFVSNNDVTNGSVTSRRLRSGSPNSFGTLTSAPD